MNQTATPAQPCDQLRMPEALCAWGDTRLVGIIQVIEASLPPHVLARARYPRLGGDAPTVYKDSLLHRHGIDEIKEAFDRYWVDLIRAWKRRIEVGELRLSGVQIHPELTERRSDIPSAWASELMFDFVNNCLSGVGRRYSAILVRQGVGAEPERAIEAAAVFDAGTFDVTTLTADEVAILLERHAEFVCKNTGITLFPSGKASPMALIATKMRERFSNREQEDTVTAEARWLAAWAASAAPSYFTVGEKTIWTKLSAEFKRLHLEYRDKPG